MVFIKMKYEDVLYHVFLISSAVTIFMLHRISSFTASAIGYRSASMLAIIMRAQLFKLSYTSSSAASVHLHYFWL